MKTNYPNFFEQPSASEPRPPDFFNVYANRDYCGDFDAIKNNETRSSACQINMKINKYLTKFVRFCIPLNLRVVACSVADWGKKTTNTGILC